jgi:hypothetical protein
MRFFSSPRSLWNKLFLSVFLSWSISASGAEISLLSGVYQSETTKVNGAKSLETDTISLGGRYGDFIDLRQAWFMEALVSFQQYEAPTNAPDNSNNLTIGGGYRYYISRISESLIPYGAVSGRYRNFTEVEGDGRTTLETSGVFYGAGIGMRMNFESQFFIDFEVPFFESALIGTSTRKTRNADGTETKEESTRMDLFVDTAGTFQSIQVAFGLIL